MQNAKRSLNLIFFRCLLTAKYYTMVTDITAESE
jgi:hypothetical protein